jgi:hypothetical protein
METIGSIIQRFLAEQKILPTGPLGDWENIVGSQVASRARPVKFKKGVLTVHVYDSIWKHHLELYKEEILQKINAHRLGLEPVTKIIFKVGELPSYQNEMTDEQPPPKTSKRPKKKAKPTKYDLSEEAQKFIKTCRDPELKKIARRLLPLFAPVGQAHKPAPTSSKEHGNNTCKKNTIEGSGTSD